MLSICSLHEPISVVGLLNCSTRVGRCLQSSGKNGCGCGTVRHVQDVFARCTQKEAASGEMQGQAGFVALGHVCRGREKKVTTKCLPTGTCAYHPLRTNERLVGEGYHLVLLPWGSAEHWTGAGSGGAGGSSSVQTAASWFTGFDGVSGGCRFLQTCVWAVRGLGRVAASRGGMF